MTQRSSPGFETVCVHHADDRERFLGAASTPLYQNSIFTFPDCASFIERNDRADGRYDYTRVSNPTTEVLEKKIAALERAEACRAFGSGMGAISAAVHSCLESGDHLVTIETVYGPTRKFFSRYLPRYNIETTFVRGTRIDDFRSALRPNTRLIYLESPSSLLFELQDLAAVAELARSRGIATLCDNSNATPYFQNPIALGIDLVAHTATKYIGGHSDLVAGLVAGSADRIRRLAEMEGELLGAVCDPFASWLMLRGLRTLPVRLDRHQSNAAAIASFLEAHPAVQDVRYPGLETHPQADLAKRQMRGQCGMLSFQLHDASREAAWAVVDGLRYFCIAVSWGGYESLAIPLLTPDPESGRDIWIIRLSVGLESVDDLIGDLHQALHAGERPS